ncbi:hypothetical protein QTO34_007566 [Cnephaeus nilssonii]|uniref:Gasdermin PUB domain-containing protein n=1 Tax=Cnephaeus nilssonii TaxID=3371016 RepID=A0AA40LGK2_CNENI|nr:hypothetical protein QTO34_007566 [Eptesicus nilssonii]
MYTLSVHYRVLPATSGEGRYGVRQGTLSFHSVPGDSDARGPQSILRKGVTPGPEGKCGGCRCGEVRGSSRNTLNSADLASSHPDCKSLLITVGDKQETFPEDELVRSFALSGSRRLTKVSGLVLRADFKLLQEEVSQKVKAAELSKDMRGVVFSNLLAMLGHREALQDLMDKLEQEPFGHLEGPGGAILTELRKDSRYPEVGSKSLLLYLLEGLMVLSDSQLDLLAQSMEKRILLPQRDLVRGILEPNFNCFQNIPFTLQPELLAPLQGEGLVITYELLDECGLKMEVNSPRSTWIPEAKEPLSALYGTLSVLTQLAEA